MSGGQKSKYSDDFLVDYIDKRVRIVVYNYALARLAQMLIAEEDIWTNVDCNINPVHLKIKEKAIIEVRAYSTISLDRFIRKVERLHNKYRVAQQMEEYK